MTGPMSLKPSRTTISMILGLTTGSHRIDITLARSQKLTNNASSHWARKCACRLMRVTIAWWLVERWWDFQESALETPTSVKTMPLSTMQVDSPSICSKAWPMEILQAAPATTWWKISSLAWTPSLISSENSTSQLGGPRHRSSFRISSTSLQLSTSTASSINFSQQWLIWLRMRVSRSSLPDAWSPSLTNSPHARLCTRVQKTILYRKEDTHLGSAPPLF